MEELLDWFRSQNGTFDSERVALTDIPEQGKGAIAVRDIPKGHILFTIPRDLTLSLRTSSLPEHMVDSVWRNLQLHRGWAGLILCMMWEESRGDDSKWSEYLRSMPTTFTTPMFWSAQELNELTGTTVQEKVGKEQAEKDYREKIIPAIQSRPDLFRPEHLKAHFSLEKYHMMGSRILSRSFQVEKWEEDGDLSEEHEENVDQNGMEVDSNDEADEPEATKTQEGLSDEEDDGDNEDSSDVAMVPMADMLNARYGSENAKLFYEPTELRMIATKEIKTGDQIYNTYGDPPNAHLLRRYGHVDVIPVSEGGDGEGNPADEVEIPADLALSSVVEHRKLETIDDIDDTLKERVDWWLEEGGDDIFVLGRDLAPPEGLISFTKLLLYSAPDWNKARAKSKPPKPKLDNDVIPLLLVILRKRLSQYPTSVEDDVKLLEDSSLTFNRRNAVIVRLAEKRILNAYTSKLEILFRELTNGVVKEKRKRPEEGRAKSEKRKRT